MNLGFEIKTNAEDITVKRFTKETKITINVNEIKNRKLSIQTSIPFLDHMIETFAWWANINIRVEIKSENKLTHTIAEDIGITLGRAILEIYKSKLTLGVEGCGFARAVLDEAVADTIISIEGRANSFVDGANFENVDGMSGYDLIAFLEGFSQGCACTLRINYSGRDSHHCWEAVFRAFGLAIRRAFQRNDWRQGTIPGLKGTLE